MIPWRQHDKNPFLEIKKLTEGLAHNTPHVAIQKVITIFNALFQSSSQCLLSTLYEDAFRHSKQAEWKKTFIYAVDLLGP
jgi:hypothetical protein